MNRIRILTAAIALAVPTIAFAEDEKTDAQPRRVDVIRLDDKASYDARTHSLVRTDENGIRVEKLDGKTKHDPRAGVLIRLQDVPEKDRQEFETLRKKIQADVDVRIKDEMKRAEAEVEKAKLDVAKAKAESAKAQKGWTLVKPKAGGVEREKAAFLGVGGSGVPQVLREQLSLPKGVGIVVEAVEPGSPAEAAGVKRFDVLHKLNDQLLVNTHQLAVLVRSMKPGQEVKLSLYRGGKEQTVAVKLVEKEMPVLGDAKDQFEFFEAPELPRFGDVPDRPNLKNWMELRKEADGNFGVLRRKLEPDGNRMVITSDEDLSVALSDTNGKKHLKVMSKGKVLFDGPFDSKEDREKLPEELRGKIGVMEDVVKFNPEVRFQLDEKFGGKFEDKGFKFAPDVKFDRDFRLEGKGKIDTRDREKRQEDFQAVEWREDDHQMRVEQRDGKKTLIAKDQDGREVFNGAIDTEEQRKAMPESLREKLDSSKWQSVMKQLDH